MNTVFFPFRGTFWKRFVVWMFLGGMRVERRCTEIIVISGDMPVNDGDKRAHSLSLLLADSSIVVHSQTVESFSRLYVITAGRPERRYFFSNSPYELFFFTQKILNSAQRLLYSLFRLTFEAYFSTHRKLATLMRNIPFFICSFFLHQFRFAAGFVLATA